MYVSKSIAEWRLRRSAMDGRTVGFVPTMGALHAGHASLVERCRTENQTTVVSIFVNPSQFNDPKDLARYPRTVETDLAMLEELGVDEVFFPSADDMYPNGYLFQVRADSITGVMEGVSRPGHFEGVMTVVLKLLNIVAPARAYFGEKDFQQFYVLKQMTADLFLPVEIVPCPTVREASGLAMSSRNMLLSVAGKDKASSIYRALTVASTPLEARQKLEAEGFRVDYIEEHWNRRFVAAYLEGIRLIDNVPLT